jgi:hypothetical protein
MQWGMAAVGCGFIAVALAAGQWLRHQTTVPDIAQVLAVQSMLFLTMIGGSLCAVMAISGRARASLVLATILMAVLVTGIDATVLPKLDPFLSARTLAAAVPGEVRRPSSMFELETGPAWVYGLEFYFDRELPPWTPDAVHPSWVWAPASTATVLLQQDARWSVVMRPTAGPWLLRFD